MSGPAPYQKCGICGDVCRSWRECPRSTCGKKVARCEAHGSDAAAQRAMINHVQKHGEEDRRPPFPDPVEIVPTETYERATITQEVIEASKERPGDFVTAEDVVREFEGAKIVASFELEQQPGNAPAIVREVKR